MISEWSCDTEVMTAEYSDFPLQEYIIKITKYLNRKCKKKLLF